MLYDNDQTAMKLRRWEKYFNNFCLPSWNEIPDFGLYMEQMIDLLGQYLDYLPPELKAEQFITPATINNYVRTKIMPEPIKKRYYREHIAYLIIIITLKQSLSIALIQRLIPMGLTKEEVERTYTDYAERHRIAARCFTEQVKLTAAPILQHDKKTEISVDKTEDLIAMSAIVSGFNRLLAEKLLLLEDKDKEKAAPEAKEKAKEKASTKAKPAPKTKEKAKAKPAPKAKEKSGK